MSDTFDLIIYNFLISQLCKNSLVMVTRQGYGSFIHRWTKRVQAIVNKAICGTKESATNADELEEWTHTILIPTLDGYLPSNICNGDETALFYKSLPHRIYCHVDDKPAGSTKRKDRLTLLVITNMDGFRPTGNSLL